MGRMEELRIVDPVLTTFARGYENSAFIGEELFPFAPVEKEAGKIPQFGKDNFKLYNTERAITADSNRMQIGTNSTIDFVLTEHDIEVPVDYREKQEDIFDREKTATKASMDIIALKHEKICGDLAQNLNSYPSGNKVTLTSTDKWSDYVNSDPVKNVDNAKETIRGKTGKIPNTMILGAEAFKTLKNHPKLIAKIQYSMKGILTIPILQEIFDIENIVVGKSVYSTDAGVLTDIWGDNAVLAYVPKVPTGSQNSVYEPAFGYTLRKKGNPVTFKYNSSNGKVLYVNTTDIYEVKIVGGEAGYLINDVS